MPTKISPIHYFYIILILVSLLVALLSVKVADSKDLSEKLSFAVSLASLLLAVVAIIQAFVSTSSLSQTLGNLTGTAERIDSASKEISVASTSLVTAVKNIPEGLAQVVERVDRTHSSVEEMMLTIRTSPADRDHDIKPSTEAKNVLRHATIGVVSALYAANRSFIGGRPLAIKDLYDTKATFGEGVLAALRSIGLIDFKVTDGNAIDVLNIGPFNNEVFDELFREMKSTDTGKRAWENLQGRVNQIDQYYRERKNDAPEL